MQPYFFPYLGYYALIKRTDQFILFDTPQFMRHSWIERNRIINQQGGDLYIKVPLKKHHQTTPINHIEINNESNWREKIFAQLAVYKKKAPYYDPVLRLIEEAISIDTSSITKLNKSIIEKSCAYMNIPIDCKIWSELDIEIPCATEPDEWALNICLALGANHYINPRSGSDFFNRLKYNNKDIQLQFLEIEISAYSQFGESFIPFLSIIDVLMFNDVGSIQKMLDQIILTN